MTNPAPVKFIAVIRAGKSHVLTVRDGHIRRTLEHEARAHQSTVIGEYNSFSTADRAAQLAERGWRRLEARKSAS
jgi:hypothetical protein